MKDFDNPFEGALGGAIYDAAARLTGYGPGFERRAALAIPLRSDSRVLDLGCGTGGLSAALARRRGGVRVTGLDISRRQLARAAQKLERSPARVELLRGSMVELPFADETFDGVVASMSLHALERDRRPAAVAEVARVLRPRGRFALVEWRPRLGFKAALWLPFVLGERDGDNWRGRYPEICAEAGLGLESEVSFSSMDRCQVFIRDRTFR
ncbi:MAG: class I SAM-dependent methyltransferase [Polyangia bacterium]